VQFERACGVGGLLHHLCTATRVLHTVSLLYDDIEDDSDTRRGEPCAHVRYGVAWTLNAASAATFAALHELAQCAADAAAAVVLQYGTSELIPLPLSGLNGDTPLLLTPPHSGAELDENQRDEARALWADALTGRLTKTCTAAMRRLHSGQGKDIWYRDMGVCPTMAEYDILCVEKTGGLFRLIADWVWVLHRPIAAAAAAAAARTRGGRVTSSPSISAAMAQRILTLCDRFGLCFQILDDYLNLCDDGAGVLKGYCEDLQEGKFSFLVVHAVWTLRQRSAAEATDPIGSTSTPNATDRCDTNAAPTVAAHNGLNSPAETELIALLRGRPRGRAEKDAILRTLHACGSFRAAVAAIEAHCDALATEVRGVDEAIIAAAGGAGTRAGGVDVVSGAVAGLLRLVDLMRTRATAAHPCGALN
jgi:geranylgeranyl pyrophosphate synthase